MYKLMHESDERVKGDEGKMLLKEMGQLLEQKMDEDGVNRADYQVEIIMSKKDGKHQLGVEYSKQ